MPPTPRKYDRWLALGLATLALLLLYALLVHPWWTVPLRETEARIAGLQEREQRIDAQLRQAEVVELRWKEVSDALPAGPGFLPESTAELATAGLVQRLETVVAQASPGQRACAIVNRSPLAPGTRERFQRVAVQARLRCGMAETAAVLDALESGSPRLFVDNLNILTLRYAGDSGGGLDVSFDLSGYLGLAQAGEAERGGEDAY